MQPISFWDNSLCYLTCRHVRNHTSLLIFVPQPQSLPLHICWKSSISQYIDVVQLLSCVWLFATPWTTARQHSLSFTISRSLLKLMSWWCHPTISSSVNPLLLLLSIFPSIRVSSNELAVHNRWPSIGVLASASVLLMNFQSWFPLGLTGLISLLSKELSRVISSTTIQKHQFYLFVINRSLQVHCSLPELGWIWLSQAELQPSSSLLMWNLGACSSQGRSQGYREWSQVMQIQLNSATIVSANTPLMKASHVDTCNIRDAEKCPQPSLLEDAC